MDPPLPVYLFNVVSGLKDKSAKGYPIKKVCLPAAQAPDTLLPFAAPPRPVEDFARMLWRDQRIGAREKARTGACITTACARRR